MPEGKPFEFSPGESEQSRIEAQRETIAEFESLAERLVSGASPAETRGKQMTQYDLSGKSVWIVYMPKFGSEGDLDAGEAETNLVASVTVSEPLDENRSRERTLASFRDGRIRLDSTIYDKEEEKRRAAEMRRIIASGDEERIKRARLRNIGELADQLRARGEEYEAGVGKATEAEVQEMNLLLKTIIYEKKRQGKKGEDEDKSA